VVAVVAASVLVAPYLRFDPGSSRLPVTSEAQFALLVVHVLAAGVALALGPLQFIPAVRRRRRWHRRIGRVYLLVGVLPAGLAGIPVALLSDRLLTQVGLVIPAVGWLVTGWLAVRAVRRGDVEAHRSWMTRNYALTFLAITARVLVPLMLLGRILLTGADPGSLGSEVPSLIPLGQVLGWIVNLAVAEIVIRRRRVVLPGRRPGLDREGDQRKFLRGAP
jgi:uncharacterized membrane protein YozB (DUF420 family)